jgi:hypothetical protein
MPIQDDPILQMYVNGWINLTAAEQQVWDDKAIELGINQDGFFLFIWQCYVQQCTAETLPPDIIDIQLVEALKPKQGTSRPPAE